MLSALRLLSLACCVGLVRGQADGGATGKARGRPMSRSARACVLCPHPSRLPAVALPLRLQSGAAVPSGPHLWRPVVAGGPLTLSLPCHCSPFRCYLPCLVPFSFLHAVLPSVGQEFVCVCVCVSASASASEECATYAGASSSIACACTCALRVCACVRVYAEECMQMTA